MGKEDQKRPLPMTNPRTLLLHPMPYLLRHPNIQNLLGGGRKRMSLCPLPVVRSKGDLKRSDSYADAPDQYIQAFISVIQAFELAWKDIMLLLDQTLSSLEKQWVLPQATQVGDDFHL
jgi:hypothetical protein